VPARGAADRRRALRYPGFVAEMGHAAGRAKIQAGIYTGYATVVAYGALAWYATQAGVLPRSRGFAALVGAKVVTNTLSWAALRARLFHLEFATLNITADLLVMTGAVYLTGGPNSPLLPIYFIEAAIMALLTNVALTVVTITASVILFAGMCVLIQQGVLALHPTPWERVGSLTPAFLVVIVVGFALSMLAPGAYVAIIVQRLREKEAALEERARDLVEAAREKSQFMANVTHELRTPIHGILGLSELLGQGVYGPVAAPQVEGLRGIERSARNLLELIDALLLFARAEVAELDVVVVPVAPGEVVASVVETARWLRGSKALELDVTVAPELPVLHTDRRRLAHLLLNLIANAIKFTPEGGRVSVVARRDGDGVALSVADTGIGIPSSHRGRIFEPFHQVDGSTSRGYGGIGLGLALVQRLATTLEATVSVESAVGEGSTFTVRLPARIAARAAAAPSDGPPA
jgi:signal transduction histidine kinase